MATDVGGEMRRAIAVPVTGAILLALLCITLMSLFPTVAGAQQNVLAGQTASIQDDNNNDTLDLVEIPFPEGQTCSVDGDGDGVLIAVTDGDTNRTFTSGDNSTIRIIREENQIVVAPLEGEGDLSVESGFEETEDGEVLSSDGIVCRDAVEPGSVDARRVAPPEAPICTSGTRQVDSFDSDDTSGRQFRVTEEPLQVLYAARGFSGASPAGRNLTIEVRQGGRQLARDTSDRVPPGRVVRGSVPVDNVGSGRIQIDVTDRKVVFAVTVCQERGGGNNPRPPKDSDDNRNIFDGDDGDVGSLGLEELECEELLREFRSSEGDQYDDTAEFSTVAVRDRVLVCLKREVVEGVESDKLPDTGGLPLVGLAALGLAAVAVGASVVRGAGRDR